MSALLCSHRDVELIAVLFDGPTSEGVDLVVHLRLPQIRPAKISAETMVLPPHASQYP
jgi:hypothetical protein